jgi:hypothetical protein
MKHVKKFEDLDSPEDIVALKKNDDGEYDKIDEPVSVVKVTGILTDEKEIDKLENQLESISGGPVFNTDLQLKQVKRGDTIWVTALLQRKGNTAWNAQTMGVLKCRIVDVYYGLNKLKSIQGRN